MQAEVVYEILQPFASRRATACSPAGEAEISQPRSLCDKHGDVIAAREVLARRQQALQSWVLDGALGVAEDVAPDTSAI
jgi:hypothetical protein